MYRSSARRTTSDTDSPRSAATRLAASQISSGTRIVRFGVEGWFGTPAR